jgi:hypothetical protein
MLHGPPYRLYYNRLVLCPPAFSVHTLSPHDLRIVDVLSQLTENPPTGDIQARTITFDKYPGIWIWRGPQRE